MRVFILEDELGFAPRNAILKALEGHTLTVAANIEEGKARYTPPYNLLLLDCDMHGFPDDPCHPNSGYTFCLWLVTQKLKARPKVILHSQNPRGRVKMRECLEYAGFTDILDMPFSDRYVKYLTTV